MEPWNSGEEAYLASAYGRLPMAEIEAYLGRHREAIRSKAWRMGLFAPSREMTTRERDYLIQHHPTHSAQEIADSLNRPVATIRQWALDLKLKKRPRKAWTPEDDALIRVHYGTMPLEELAERVEHTPQQTRLRASRLKVTRKQAAPIGWTPNKRRLVFGLRLMGWSWEEVAGHAGLTLNQVVGMARRSRNAAGQRPQHQGPEHHEPSRHE